MHQTYVRELENNLSTNRNITDIGIYTLFNISVAGYTRVGTANFSETQCWTDEEGEKPFNQDESFVILAKTYCYCTKNYS